MLKRIMATLSVALLMSVGASYASDLNEVAALLVFPAVTALPDQETFMTVTNASADSIYIHVSFINGDELDPLYCFECDFSIYMSGNDTETMVLSAGITGTGISIESEDGSVSSSCPQEVGFVVVTVEDEAGNTLGDNILLGEEVVVDYANGYAWSVPAVPFQATAPNGDRYYLFDDAEYAKFPRIVAADFIAPDLTPGISAELALFTLNFDRQHPPLTDCSVTGYDAEEYPFSRSFLFGCWTLADLVDVSPEFAYPNLGQFSGDNHTHGWLQLNCRVDRENFPEPDRWDAMGGVHGAIIQKAKDGAVIRRNDPAAPALSGSAAWARLLYQSVTTGDPTTLCIESAPQQDLLGPPAP